MEQELLKLPKKILRVEELTFELPNDFEGNIQDALNLLVAYLHDVFGDKDTIPIISNKPIPSLFQDPEDHKLNMKYGIFERGEDGKYYLK